MPNPKLPDSDVKEAIQRIITYNWEDEKFDYEAFDGDDSHIFTDLEKVQLWLHSEKDK